jgi:hypothetical protein
MSYSPSLHVIVTIGSTDASRIEHWGTFKSNRRQGRYHSVLRKDWRARYASPNRRKLSYLRRTACAPLALHSAVPRFRLLAASGSRFSSAFVGSQFVVCRGLPNCRDAPQRCRGQACRSQTPCIRTAANHLIMQWCAVDGRVPHYRSPRKRKGVIKPRLRLARFRAADGTMEAKRLRPSSLPLSLC